MGEGAQSNLAVDPDSVTVRWSDSQHYSPAPRHRRRLILNRLRGLAFQSFLDAGCAQGYLLEAIHNLLPEREAYGCDLSAEAIRLNRTQLPWGHFETLDLAAERWPGQRQFELVLCSEVLEHIPDWQAAAANLAAMTARHLLITVPGGKRYWIDEHIGHHHHFAGPELAASLGEHGLRLRQAQHWGFPIHSLYKKLINQVAPEQMYASFGEGTYGPGKKLVSNLVYGLFYANDLFQRGSQLVFLFERS